MALFDRSNRDREGRAWGGAPEYGGHDRGGFVGGVRRGFQRLENGVRDAFDRGGYDHDYGAAGYGGRDLSDRGRWTGGAGGSDWNQQTGGRYAGGWSHAGRDNPAGYDRDFGGGGEELNRWRRDLGDQGNYGYRGTEGAWSTIRNHGRYDEGYQGSAWGAGYDADFARRRGMLGGGAELDRPREWDRDRGNWDRDDSGMYGRDRHQTDTGDPFGDRASRTPFRMMRGGFDRYETDRGGWGEGNRLNRLGPGGDYDRDFRDTRGWNQGIGDDPYYNASDLRGGYDRNFRRGNRDFF